MNNEKFEEDSKTLGKFFQKYCEDKHKNRKIKEYKLFYKNKQYNYELFLCDNCHKLIAYSFEKLNNCPHEIKPRCRKCPNPCYDKNEWKNLARIMKYSGIKFGLVKLKKIFTIR